MSRSYIYFLKTHFSKRIQLTVHDARQRFQNIAISVLDLVRQSSTSAKGKCTEHHLKLETVVKTTCIWWEKYLE